MKHKYSELPFLYQEAFDYCEYAKAAACRRPIRDAINTARTMPENKMEQLINVLEAALAHIRQEQPDAEPTQEVLPELPAPSDDPLDGLLGPAEDEPDADFS